MPLAARGKDHRRQAGERRVRTRARHACHWLERVESKIRLSLGRGELEAELARRGRQDSPSLPTAADPFSVFSSSSSLSLSIKSTGLARCVRFGAHENDRRQDRRRDQRGTSIIPPMTIATVHPLAMTFFAPRGNRTGRIAGSASPHLSICMTFSGCPAPRLELTRVDGCDMIKRKALIADAHQRLEELKIIPFIYFDINYSVIYAYLNCFTIY